MLAPIYTFGPHVSSDIALALQAALNDAYPGVSFELVSDIDIRSGTPREILGATVIQDRRLASSSYQSMITFARGFVAGYSPRQMRSAPVSPGRYATVPGTPATKRDSERPAKGALEQHDTFPEFPAFPVVERTLDFSELSLPVIEPAPETGPRRYRTVIGVAPPSKR